jgi:hypothetical protein
VTATSAAVGRERAVAETLKSAQASLPERATDLAPRPLRATAEGRTDPDAGSGRVVLILLTLTAAGLTAALAIRRRRGGSGSLAEPEVPLVPGDPAVEAELQEIISEERARLDPDERRPAELAAARDDPG